MTLATEIEAKQAKMELLVNEVQELRKAPIVKKAVMEGSISSPQHRQAAITIKTAAIDQLKGEIKLLSKRYKSLLQERRDMDAEVEQFLSQFDQGVRLIQAATQLARNFPQIHALAIQEFGDPLESVVEQLEQRLPSSFPSFKQLDDGNVELC